MRLQGKNITARELAKEHKALLCKRRRWKRKRDREQSLGRDYLDFLYMAGFDR